MGIFDSVLSSAGSYTNARSSHSPSFGTEDAFWNSVRKPTDEDLRKAWILAINRYGLQSNAPDEPVIDDSLVPRETDKQRSDYRKILKHDIYGARIYGKPGSGLSDSSFGEREIRTGTMGETVFAKLLAWDGVLDHCISFWSVCRPEENGTRDSNGTDIDCILKFGDHILLVDVKNYRSGLEYHTLVQDKAMFCMYTKARVVAHKPYIFSSNMAFAQRNVENYLKAHGSRCTVESFVVLVPSSVGQATLDADIRWPGGIQAMSYTTFLNMLNSRAMQDNSYTQTVPLKTPEEGWLATLVKDYGEIPLSLLDNPMSESLWPRPSFDRAAGIGMDKHKKKTAGEKTSSKTKSGSNNQSSTRRRNTEKASATSRGKNKRNELESMPSFGRDCSLELLLNENGRIEPLSFKNVSGFITAGWNGSGVVMSMGTLIASLVASPDTEVHIVDCNKTSYFERFEDAADSYVQLMDGLDLVCSQIQSLYTSTMSRSLALKRTGTSFWDGVGTHSLKPCFLFINECSRLFDMEENLTNDADKQSFNDIQRYLRVIMDKGCASGLCVILCTQKPSKHALPEALVQASQVRACFHVPYKNIAQVILGDGFDKEKMFGEKTPVCQALLWRQDMGLCQETFMTVESSQLDKVFPG